MKGVIIAAGYGTRFLPATKTIPKELLPLVDKPSIDFIIDEFIHSGIKEILLVTSRRKKALEDYLDREVELEAALEKSGNLERLKLIHPPEARFYFIRQQRMMGTGHALLAARTFVGDDPCVVAYPDDIHMGTPPLAAQLIEEYEKSGLNVLATLHDPPDINRYGIIALDPDGIHVRDIVEKPPAGEEPSREASIGRFLYTPDMFRYLEEGLKRHSGGEYYHIYALRRLAAEKKLVFRAVRGLRLDTGEPAGYLRALLKYALSRPDLESVLKEALREEGLCL